MMSQVAFLALSYYCCFELLVLTLTLWNNNTKVYFYALLISVLCSLTFTVGITIFFCDGSGTVATNWTSMILCTFGYWLYIPAEFMVMFARYVLKSIGTSR
jgi:hypothetical protein